MDIPIKDTEAWVNRSREERQKEATKDSFVKRPLNSFILYRSAYADRAKSFQKSGNHQIVSSLAGESWAMEPPEIRKQFDKLAKTDRENHAKAFPEYKFQPQMNKAAARERKKGMEDFEEEESDFKSDYAYDPRASGRPLKSRKYKNAYLENSYVLSGTSLEEYDAGGIEGSHVYHPSSYQTSNPGKQIPAALNQLSGGQHYQTTNYPGSKLARHGYVEDVIIQPSDALIGFNLPGASIIDIPRVFHHEFQGDNNNQSTLIDPILANYDQDQAMPVLASGHTNHTQEVTPTLHSGGFQLEQFSPILNDSKNNHIEQDVGSDDW